MKLEMMGWQWHQLDHLKSFAPRFRQIKDASTSSVIFTGRMLFLMTNQQWTEGNEPKLIYTDMWEAIRPSPTTSTKTIAWWQRITVVGGIPRSSVRTERTLFLNAHTYGVARYFTVRWTFAVQDNVKPWFHVKNKIILKNFRPESAPSVDRPK